MIFRGHKHSAYSISIYPKELKVGSQRNICTYMFTSPIFTIANNGSNLGSTNGWTDKQNVVFVYNVLLFNLKRKDIMTYATTWMLLKDILLSEISLSQKDKYYRILLIDIHRVVKIIEIGSRMVVSWAGGQRMESYFLMGVEFQFYKMKTLMEMDGGRTTLWMYLITLSYTLKND